MTARAAYATKARKQHEEALESLLARYLLWCPRLYVGRGAHDTVRLNDGREFRVATGVVELDGELVVETTVRRTA